MRVKTLLITWELFRDLFTEGDHQQGYRVINDAIPEDGRLLNVRPAWGNNALELLIESDSFPEVKDGDTLPSLIPTTQTLPSSREFMADVTKQIMRNIERSPRLDCVSPGVNPSTGKASTETARQ